MLTALASVVPLVGTALVWVPAVIVLLAQGRTWAALFLVIWSLGLVTSVDNVIRPLVVSGRAGLPTLAVFLGLVGGLAAFGAIGTFLGPVIVALTIALLRFAEESRTARRHGPLSEPRVSALGGRRAAPVTARRRRGVPSGESRRRPVGAVNGRSTSRAPSRISAVDVLADAADQRRALDLGGHERIGRVEHRAAGVRPRPRDAQTRPIRRDR